MEIFVKHKKYVLNDKNLLCEVVIQKQNQMIDLDTRTLKLYWCKKDIFILDEVHDINGQHETPIFMNKTEAQSFTDKYPFNVNKDVYIKAFGKHNHKEKNNLSAAGTNQGKASEEREVIMEWQDNQGGIIGTN